MSPQLGLKSAFARFSNALSRSKSVMSSYASRLSTNASPSLGDAQYSMGVKLMHWGAGAGILSCILYVKAAQNSKGEQKGNFMFLHKSIGLVMLGVIPVRVALRLASKTPLPVPGSALEQLGAKLSHTAMYGMMVFMPVSGWAMGYYGGKGLPFFYTTLPGAEKTNGEIAKNAYKFHKLVGEAMTYLIPIHIGAVGVHYAKGQKILQRINPLSK